MESEELRPERWAPPWWGVFLIGLLLWVASIAVARLTYNVIVLPTIVLLGSFLVPVTAVVWYLDHDPSPALSPVWLWLRADGGGVLPRRRAPVR